MSILLDALRKSEKSQHTQEVPTIHSEDQSGPVSESLKLGPLALLLIVALFTSGWLVWRQYQAPAGGIQTPVTQAADTTPHEAITPAPDPQAGSGDRSQTAPAKPAAVKAVAQKRTPVETYEKPVSTASQSQVPSDRKTSTNSQANAAKDGSTSQSSSAATAGNKSAAKPGQSERRQPDPISYWELPDAIRAKVPEIKFSVLVYSKNPEDRFVLINGQRHREGDSLQSGPVVKEIRREGVVFSYRLYQFLVER